MAKRSIGELEGPPAGEFEGAHVGELQEEGADEQAEESDFGKLVLQLTPSEKFGEALKEAVEVIGEHVAGVHPGADMKTFGSAVQGAHLDGSDLDLCVDVPDLNDEVVDPWTMGSGNIDAEAKKDNTSHVNALKKIIAKLPGSLRVFETRFFKHMKVPIVTLSFKSSLDIQVDADLSIGTVFEGVEKGFTDRLVRRVLARFPKALHMVRVVKLWAKAERLNKAYEGFLNALGWTLLVVFFFMDRGEILSGLLDVEEPNERGVGGGGLPPPLENGVGDPPGIDEVPSVEETAEFFEWVVSMWSEWPRDGTWAISLVDGAKIEIEPEEKRWNDTCDLFIEDPGVRMSKDVRENVARSLKAGHWTASVRQCAVTAKALRSEDPGAAGHWMNVLRAKAATKESTIGQQLQAPTAIRAGAPQMVAPPMMLRPDHAAMLFANNPWARPWGEAVGALEPPAKKYKTPCRWFKLGECWDGDRCRNSHEL